MQKSEKADRCGTNEKGVNSRKAGTKAEKARKRQKNRKCRKAEKQEKKKNQKTQIGVLEIQKRH